MSMKGVGSRRTHSPKTTTPVTSTKVSQPETQPTIKKTTGPRVQQDSTGKAKKNTSVETRDHLSNVSSGSKMERAKKGTGRMNVQPRGRTKQTGETQKTGTGQTKGTKGGKTTGTGKGQTQKTGLKYRPKRQNIKAQDAEGQKAQRRIRTGLKNIKSSQQPQGTKEEQLARLRSKEGKTGGDSVELQPGRDLKMKRMGEQYRTGERDQPTRTVRVGTDDVQVKDKVWQGGGTATRVLNEQQKKEAETKFGEKTWNGQSTRGYDQQGQMNVKLTDGSGRLLEGQSRMFAMDGKGKVHSAKETQQIAQDNTRVDSHHSMFTDGKSVSGAGKLTTRQDGTLGKIDDGSGHYKPGAKQTLQTMRELERKGVAMDNVQFDMQRGTPDKRETTSGMVNEYRQGGGSESTFKGRHEVTNELKEKMKGVRNTLDRQARERRTDVKQREKKPYQSGPPEPRKPEPKQEIIRGGYIKNDT